MKSAAIVGAGITGLTAGCTLKDAGVAVRAFESGGRVGGVLRSWREQGFLAESGPNSLQVVSPDTLHFLNKRGLDTLESAPMARKRFVVWKGRLEPLPLSLWQFLRTPLLSVRGKLRLLGEPFIRRTASEPREESIAAFTRRRLGDEVVDAVLNPFIAGIYAGDAEALSVRYALPRLYALEQRHGSLFKGAWRQRRTALLRGASFKPRTVSFQGGMEALPRKLGEQLGDAVSLNVCIEAIRRCNAQWQIHWRFASEETLRTSVFDALILTLPAYRLAALPFEPALAKRLQLFNEIEYPPLSVLVLGVQREQVAHPLDGFGFLVPEKEQLSVLGALFSSTLFPNRAPSGYVTLTVFVGGVRQPECARLPTKALRERVMDDLQHLIGLKPPLRYCRHMFWPRAIPQYTLGYNRFLDRFDALEGEHAGLYFAGHYRDGVALGQCIEAGLRCAQNVLAF